MQGMKEKLWWRCADLRAAEGKERRSGKAPLQKLTTHQRQVVERLRAAHGDDIEVTRSRCNT